ncbi:hypothetical protein ACIG0C_11170 [Kitasatospora aureofaciens]|uniref:Uncharacterized protein n=1 Tax=Kitasatospora aureofaciens TaxID=1894 RepID=A0A1E7MW15_KITAU|nr:hypothetical protein [Kitasatospora aureofaciens]ARF78346.1 hypothetical protein B6264_04915 [Kitasatospora aureofaciens]OEV32614.1 hypothetical protein HS99_0015165 [Kitasatospora aureofaciens]UKZ05660.1 hypothetical protein BOQ63_016745 [Streptomyces viridifaciens]GGU79817.1 hypothetical protein GCM10010502_34640 [Kitasatospora aureofaciens]
MDATLAARGNTARARRRPGRRAALCLAAVTVLALGATACKVDTQTTADRVEVCSRVLGLTLFDPFPNDADKARKDVRERADKLDELAKIAPDDDLRKAVETTAKSLRDAQPKDHGARTVVDYLAEQNDRLRDLRKTCTDSKKY